MKQSLAHSLRVLVVSFTAIAAVQLHAQNFVPASTNSSLGGPNSVTVADVNGDGRLDLISPDTADNMLLVFTNKGNGSFAPATSYKAGNGPFWVTAADVNRDGKVDLISANALVKQFFSEDRFWKVLLPGIEIKSAMEYDGTKESTESAAKALLGELHKRNIVASGTMPIGGTNPPNLIVIEIGEKPNLYETQNELINEEMEQSTNRAQLPDLMQKLRDLSK